MHWVLVGCCHAACGPVALAWGELPLGAHGGPPYLRSIAHHTKTVPLSFPLQKHRKEQKHQFFQKTKRGQPVMKARIEKMLEQLQAGG